MDTTPTTLQSAANDLTRRYAAGDLSASAYRRQLAHLHVQAAQTDVPPTRKRSPVQRTARSPRADARETRS
jgi:hypothetical protein